MKKLYTTPKYKRHNSRIAKKRLKNRLRRRRKSKGFRYIRSREKIISDSIVKTYTHVNAPENFSMIENPEETVKFIDKLDKLFNDREKTFVNLEKVVNLDYSAVTVLVSVMFIFKAKGIKFNGNFPKNQELGRLLVDSGFFRYLSRSVGDKVDYTLGKPNQIFTRANKKVNSALSYLVMAESSRTIWGSERTCKGLHRILIELMQNTHNHANSEEEGSTHWWLSVNHDKQNKKVSFVFVDYGIGIFESLKKKPKAEKWANRIEKLKQFFSSHGNPELLRALLEGEVHMTVTGQHFRGKGLPGIKQVLERNQISNLHVISNDVFANVEKSQYITLKSTLNGTFVYWELNQTNENLPWVTM